MKQPEIPNPESPTSQRILQKRISSIGMPKPPVIDDHETPSKTIYYFEYNAGRRIRHKMDFNSPRTCEAAAQLGLTFSDCLLK